MTKPFLDTEEKRRNVEKLYPLKIGRPEDVGNSYIFGYANITGKLSLLIRLAFIKHSLLYLLLFIISPIFVIIFEFPGSRVDHRRDEGFSIFPGILQDISFFNIYSTTFQLLSWDTLDSFAKNHRWITRFEIFPKFFGGFPLVPCLKTL